MIKIDGLAIPLFTALVTLSLMWWRDWHVTKKAIDWLEDENNRLSEEHNDLVDMCKKLLYIFDTYKGCPEQARSLAMSSFKKILKDIDECVNPNCQSGTRIQELTNEE